MSRFGHAQFSQPIRVLPDTINQSESLMSRLIRIENPRSAKLFKFKPETLICEKLFSKKQLFDDCKLSKMEYDSFIQTFNSLTSG